VLQKQLSFFLSSLYEETKMSDRCATAISFPFLLLEIQSAIELSGGEIEDVWAWQMVGYQERREGE